MTVQEQTGSEILSLPVRSMYGNGGSIKNSWKKVTSKYVLITWIILTLLSCEDIVEIEIPGQSDLVTVEGWVENHKMVQRLSIKKSLGFSQDQRLPVVPDATVNVLGSDGTNIPYQFSDQAQVYLSNISFSGKPQVNYRIEIRLTGGAVIESRAESMPSAPIIGSLNYDFFLRDDPENPEFEIRVYYPVLSIDDGEATEDFYRCRLFRNDTLFEGTGFLFITSDRFVNGETFTLALNQFEYQQGDEIKLELQSISEAAYNYYRNLITQTTTLGANNTVTPAPLEGNLWYRQGSGERVLGYFGTRAITRDSVLIN